MSVLAERHHDQQVSKHGHDDNDGEKDGENNRLQRAQEFLLLLLFLLFGVYYVIQQKTAQNARKTTCQFRHSPCITSLIKMILIILIVDSRN